MGNFDRFNIFFMVGQDTMAIPIRGFLRICAKSEVIFAQILTLDTCQLPIFFLNKIVRFLQVQSLSQMIGFSLTDKQR